MLVRHPESVAIVAVQRDVGGEDMVVVVVQPRAGAPKPTVELPAGKLEPGEEPGAAAVRELREECSLAATSWRALGSFWAVPAYSTERVHAFEARELRPARGQPDADEEITVNRLAVAGLPGALSDAISIAAYALWVASDSRAAHRHGAPHLRGGDGPTGCQQDGL